MKRSLHSVDVAAASAATPPPPQPAVLPFPGSLVSINPGSLGPLRNQLYPLRAPGRCDGETRSGLVSPLTVGAPRTHSHVGPHKHSRDKGPPPGVEVISVDDDDDEMPPVPASASMTRCVPGACQDLNGSSTISSGASSSNKASSSACNSGAYSSIVSSGSRNNSGSKSGRSEGGASSSSSSSLGSSDSSSRDQVAARSTANCSAGARVVEVSRGEASAQEAGQPSTEPSNSAFTPKAFIGSHSKSLWIQGRQRPEQVDKHISDLRTKVAVGKVTLRGTVFPSTATAAAFMKAVSQTARVTSFSISAPEMPQEQFAAVCEGLGSCVYLNHVDCNSIGNKPLSPAALQLLLQQLQLLPDLREVNLSGNEFASPGAPVSSQSPSSWGPWGPLLDGAELLKGLLRSGVLCLLARECGLRQLRQFLLWVLNRCHCLRLRQLDLGASSKLLTTLVPGETFDEELLRRVSRLSKSTWRMGKVIGDYAPPFQAVNLWKPHMAHTFWLYCLLDAMVSSSATATDEAAREGVSKTAEVSLPPASLGANVGASGRLPLIRVWGIPTDQAVSTPSHAAYFRYGYLVARLGDRCLVRWVPLGSFLAAVEEDLIACENAASRKCLRQPQQQQGASGDPPNTVQQRAAATELSTCGTPHRGGTPVQASSSTSATPKQGQQQQRGSVGGRMSARLAGVLAGGGVHAESLTGTFGAYDACIEATRVEPAVFAFAVWRQQLDCHSKCCRPGQWVEVISSKKEDKRFLYSAIGIVQQTLPSTDGSVLMYRVEYLGLPPRSFTRLTLGVSPTPADVAEVLRSTVRVAVVPAERVRPLAFLAPNALWTLDSLRERWGASNCVGLPEAYGVDLKCPAYGARVVYAVPVASRDADNCVSSASSSSGSSNAASSGGSVNSCAPETASDAAAAAGARWHIQLNCQHLEFAAKQLLHPRQLFYRFGLEGDVSLGGTADQFGPLGVTEIPPPLSPRVPARASGAPSSPVPADRAENGSATVCWGGATSPEAASRGAGASNESCDRTASLRTSLTPGGSTTPAGLASPRARKRLWNVFAEPGHSGAQQQQPEGQGMNQAPRKKQQKPTITAQKAPEVAQCGPGADPQLKPAAKRTPQDSSVVVELSDEDAPARKEQQQHIEKPREQTPEETREFEKTTASRLELACTSPLLDAPEKNLVDGNLDTAMWHTVRTCVRCRMPMPPSQAPATAAAAAGGAAASGESAPAAACGPPAEGAASAVAEGPPGGGQRAPPWVEGVPSAAGVLRRFRAYVRRIKAETCLREMKRLNRLLEDLQLPLPAIQGAEGSCTDQDSNSSGSVSSSGAPANGSSSSISRHQKSGGKLRSDRDQEAFERCVQVVGGVASPAVSAGRQQSNSCNIGSSNGSSISSNSSEHELPSDAACTYASCTVSRSEWTDPGNDQWSATASDCCCTCRECACCCQRIRFTSAEYHTPQGPPECENGTPADAAAPYTPASPEQQQELSPEEWEVVTRAMGILLRRGVIGVVAHERTSSALRVRLLPLPRLPIEKPATGPTVAGAPFVTTTALPADSLDEEEELQELRRVLEQRREPPYWGIDKVRSEGARGGDVLAREGESLLGEGEEDILCHRCLEEGWVSEFSLPRLLDRYRSACTDTTCNAPSCGSASGRCGCRSAARKRRPTASKPQVFGWSRNSTFHGIAASAEACNISQQDAELTYSEYACMQLESLH
ncbi:hypothetical protein, conserved [Eimeria necatrix]|uniref:Uncharacterized protein n=1 Tax=Eimeria necatrix TaxID=51315 RepID=U6N0V1_9EIME|nr:hypothetical protein, conserved [Eimeria necatrix]CDJ68399.1 hypothetical protein, conserved [Eimeria necatrix]